MKRLHTLKICLAFHYDPNYSVSMNVPWELEKKFCCSRVGCSLHVLCPLCCCVMHFPSTCVGNSTVLCHYFCFNILKGLFHLKNSFIFTFYPYVYHFWHSSCLCVSPSIFLLPEGSPLTFLTVQFFCDESSKVLFVS